MEKSVEFCSGLKKRAWAIEDDVKKASGRTDWTNKERCTDRRKWRNGVYELFRNIR